MISIPLDTNDLATHEIHVLINHENCNNTLDKSSDQKPHKRIDVLPHKQLPKVDEKVGEIAIGKTYTGIMNTKIKQYIHRMLL